MPQLPFKTQPRQETRLIGTADTGQLEFPVFHALKWNERQALRKADAGFSLFRETALVAAPIAEGEGLSHLDAHAMVTRILSAALGVNTILQPNELEIRAKYSEPITSLIDQVVAWNDRRQIAGVTAVIVNRLPACQDWTEADTLELGEPLIAAIYNFVSEEEAGQAPQRTEDEEQAELIRDLGKSSPEPGSLPLSPTGSESSGDSGASTQELQSSGQTALALTPSPTSSAPSKKESGKNGSGSTAASSPSPS